MGERYISIGFPSTQTWKSIQKVIGEQYLKQPYAIRTNSGADKHRNTQSHTQLNSIPNKGIYGQNDVT